MSDIEGRYLSDNEIEAINSYLLQNGCSTINDTPNITPENWVKSFIRDKKINKIING